jgi:hypothetical protein
VFSGSSVVQTVASVSPSSIILFVNLLVANDLSSSNLVAAFAPKTGG